MAMITPEGEDDTRLGQWHRKGYLVRGLSFNSIGERYRVQSARQTFSKPCPLISENTLLDALSSTWSRIQA